MVNTGTSSNLKKAFIQVLNANGKQKKIVPVLFNPSEYSMEKSNEFASINIPGLESPILQFSRGNLQTLTMDLFFDSYELKTDVRDFTNTITNLLKIDPSIHAPPILRFVWGSLIFTCVLTRVTKKFTMFQEDGIPVRATLNVTFNEYKSDTNHIENPLQSPDRTKIYEIKKGDSLWSIAAEEYGDAAQWRPLADINNIRNPRLLEIGREITIPPLDK